MPLAGFTEPLSNTTKTPEFCFSQLYIKICLCREFAPKTILMSNVLEGFRDEICNLIQERNDDLQVDDFLVESLAWLNLALFNVPEGAMPQLKLNEFKFQIQELIDSSADQPDYRLIKLLAHINLALGLIGSGEGGSGGEGGRNLYAFPFTQSNLSGNTLTMTHGLGKDVLVASLLNNNKRPIEVDYQLLTSNVIRFDMINLAPITGIWQAIIYV